MIERVGEPVRAAGGPPHPVNVSELATHRAVWQDVLEVDPETMTLLLGVHAGTSAVIAADTEQIGANLEKYPDAPKLVLLPGGVVIGGAGSACIIRAVIDSLERSGSPWSQARIEAEFKDIALVQHRRFNAMPAISPTVNEAHFLLAIPPPASNGAAMLYETGPRNGYAASESPLPYSIIGLRDYSEAIVSRVSCGGRLTLDEAKRLAAIAIVATAACVHGVNDTMTMFVVDDTGTHPVSESECTALICAAKRTDWRSLISSPSTSPAHD